MDTHFKSQNPCGHAAFRLCPRVCNTQVPWQPGSGLRPWGLFTIALADRVGLYGCAGKAREAVNGHSLDNERNAASAAIQTHPKGLVQMARICCVAAPCKTPGIAASPRLDLRAIWVKRDRHGKCDQALA